MKVNSNYSWIKCTDCKKITKILPGQKFNIPEDFAKLFECDCIVRKPKQTPKKKVVKDAT